MNEQKNESTNLITVRGELALLLIVIMNSFGVVLMLYSGSGISAISSVPYAFSEVFPQLTLGTWTYLFQGLLILSLMILRKKFVPSYLLSFDMYPLYWTTSKEGIFMHYSYEFKLMCVELYLSGSYPDIPEGVNPDTLKSNIRQWARLVDLHGPEVLKHKVFNKVWTPEEKFELVSKVIAGIPKKKVAIEAGINPGMLYQWLHKYKLQGYNGLVESKKGRPTKEPRMKKSTNPLPLTESEREELIRLRAENEYIKAENEVIKKRIALRQEKWAAQLKAKKQQSSKNSEKRDTN